MLTIRRLSREEAQILIDGAALKAQEIKVPMCIAVTDESGHLIRFDRMDGGKISSISIAI
ncbi:MAG TPA: heme-binding protein, partial [Stellaceae bacterium]|nr:heme-binding protein [Stellaceae bacterium]